MGGGGMRVICLAVALLLAAATWHACGAGSLLPNGSLEQADSSSVWPALWPKSEGVTWVKEEGGNHFLRFDQATPGTLVMLRVVVGVPESAGAVRLGFRVRYEGIVAGVRPWFDGVMMVRFRDALADGAEVLPQPEYFHFAGTSKGWEEHAVTLLVPKGAKALELSPGLFQAAKGTLDLDEVEVRVATGEEVAKAREEAVERQPLPVPAKEVADKAKWPAEIHVEGNELRTKEGKVVWLQGIVIPSLEWSQGGENALASAKVALEEWKANILRLEVRDDFWFGKGSGQKDGGASYRALVDEVVTLAANRGAYVMLDLHRYRAPKLEHVVFWKEVAAAYKNHPAVLFDLFNEPHDISWEVWRNGGWVEEKVEKSNEDAFLSEEEKAKREKSFSSPGMQALLETVRETGALNVVVVAGLNWSYDLTGVANGFALEDKVGRGVMYSWHVYNWHTGWEQNVLAAAAKYPILIGECGADAKKMPFVPENEQEDPATWVPDFLGFVQKHKLNWTGFAFHPRCAPELIKDWKFTPTPWGAAVKEALGGKQFEMQRVR
ncbi:hypothetical protein BH09VER1_BH09VER1_46160 [soil metagenome]